MSQPQPRVVVDPTTGRPILLAPQRQQRPMHTGSKKVAARCPFCRGNEDDTPPERDAVRGDDGGWLVRAFENKYPATVHHEVIAEGGDHREHPCELDVATWRAALELWRRRVQTMEQDLGLAHAFLFKNVGARAGASIAHNHSQVIGLEQLPPRLQLELAQQREAAACGICASLRTATSEDRAVFGNDGYLVFSPDPPKLPFETVLAPRDCGSDFFAADLGELAEAMHAWFEALDRGLDRPACNLWLHRIRSERLRDGEHFHWHFELQPRTGQLAGLELGGDMYINSVPAQLTAQRLRDGRRR
jgi:UDPglucose--hexose-1-phosphate uridylyltransferase